MTSAVGPREACFLPGVQARRSGLCAACPERRVRGRLERIDEGLAEQADPVSVL